MILTAAVLISTVATTGIFAGAATAQSQGPPGGMIGIDTTNIHVNGQAASGLANTDEYRVYSSAGADTLTVSYDVEFTKNNNANACDVEAVGSNPNCEVAGLSIDLTDNKKHDGRQIAIKKTVVDEASGEPGVVHIEHESGDQYVEPVDTHGDYYVFEVDHFSTNTVTFSGETVIDAPAATNGSTYQYDISDADSIDNFSIDLTGVTATDDDTETASGLINGESMGINMAGDSEPTGQGITEPQLTITGTSGNESDYTGTADSALFAGHDGSQVFNSEIQIEASPAVIDGVWLHQSSADPDVPVEVDIIEDEGPDSDVTEGTEVIVNSQLPDETGWVYVPFDNSYSTSSTGSSVTIQFQSLSGTSGDSVSLYHAGDGSGKFQSDLGTHGTPSVKLQSPPRNVDITADSGQSVAVGDMSIGGSQTSSIDLSLSSSQLDVSADGGGVDLELDYRERQTTQDPTVSVNGNEAGYTGTLSEGSTVSVTALEGWINTGTNKVDVTVGGSTSEDAPTPQVGLDYRHDTTDDQSITYEANKWTERYNVSKTYGADTDAATLTIPFDGNVLSVSNIETRTNGGSWTSVADSAYSFDNTELTVTLGSMNAGDEVEVRTTGQKVVVIDGSITVTDPTTKGQSLDTGFRIDSWSDNAYISLAGTPDGERVHETYEESWSERGEFTEVTAAGYNRMYLPNAGTDSTARVRTTPLGLAVDSGEVEVEMISAQMPLEFSVSSGANIDDQVEYTYYNAQSGDTYILNSVTNDVVIDTAEANSPVTLVGSDSGQILEIVLDSDSTTSSDPASGGFVMPIDDGSKTSLLNSPVVLMSAGIALLVALYYIQRRIFGETRESVAGIPTSGIFVVGAAIVTFVIVDIMSGNTLSTGIASGIGEVAPMLAILASGLALYYLYKRFIKGQDTTVVVRGDK